MVEIKNFSYSDVLDVSFPYKESSVLSSYLRDNNKLITLISNPSCRNDGCPEVVVAIVDNVLAGATFFMPTRMLIEGKETTDVLSGAGLETIERYRKYDIGTELMFYPFLKTKYEHIIYSGISQDALKMYKALGFCLLSTPYSIQIRSGRVPIGMIGINGKIAGFLSTILNCFIKPVIWFLGLLSSQSNKNITIKELSKVPDWVNEIINKDSHKYAEKHDQKWLQWTIDNNFYARKHDRQAFYAIFKDDNPLGYFCINERQKKIKGGRIKNIVFGNVYEWGSFDESIISEYAIFKYAQTRFSKSVDVVTYSSSNKIIMDKIRKYLFFHYGFAHIVYKNTLKRCKDAADINQWRIRYGYCDTPFYF